MEGRTFLDKWVDWPGFVGLLALGFVPEVLPLAFGTGERATGDWGFLYVTCHFVLLPAASLFLIVGGAVQLARGPAGRRRRAVLPMAVAVALLVGLALFPLPWSRL